MSTVARCCGTVGGVIRIIKPEGFGNIQLQDAAIPDIEARQVLVRTEATLISRGSELFRRYIKEEEVPQRIMGYSLAGTVERVGAAVGEYRVGQRVFVTAPHAQYAVGDVDSTDARLVPLPEGVTSEQATLLRLATEATAWAASSGARRGDTIVILGQGVVGSLMLQILRGYQPARIVTVDPLPLRQRLSRELGADLVIDPGQEDPVAAVSGLTGGAGADLVVDCGRLRRRAFVRAGAGHGAPRRHPAAHRRLPAAPAALHSAKAPPAGGRHPGGRAAAQIALRAAAMIERGEIQPTADHPPLPLHRGQGGLRLPVERRRPPHLARIRPGRRPRERIFTTSCGNPTKLARTPGPRTARRTRRHHVALVSRIGRLDKAEVAHLPSIFAAMAAPRGGFTMPRDHEMASVSPDSHGGHHAFAWIQGRW